LRRGGRHRLHRLGSSRTRLRRTRGQLGKRALDWRGDSRWRFGGAPRGRRCRRRRRNTGRRSLGRSSRSGRPRGRARCRSRAGGLPRLAGCTPVDAGRQLRDLRGQSLQDGSLLLERVLEPHDSRAVPIESNPQRDRQQVRNHHQNEANQDVFQKTSERIIGTWARSSLGSSSGAGLGIRSARAAQTQALDWRPHYSTALEQHTGLAARNAESMCSVPVRQLRPGASLIILHFPARLHMPP
jgi:hypothetical protein